MLVNVCDGMQQLLIYRCFCQIVKGGSGEETHTYHRGDVYLEHQQAGVVEPLPPLSRGLMSRRDGGYADGGLGVISVT